MFPFNTPSRADEFDDLFYEFMYYHSTEETPLGLSDRCHDQKENIFHIDEVFQSRKLKRNKKKTDEKW